MARILKVSSYTKMSRNANSQSPLKPTDRIYLMGPSNQLCNNLWVILRSTRIGKSVPQSDQLIRVLTEMSCAFFLGLFTRSSIPPSQLLALSVGWVQIKHLC